MPDSHPAAAPTPSTQVPAQPQPASSPLPARISKWPFFRASAALARFPARLLAALRVPPPGGPEWAQRVMLMERDIMLPVKAVALPLSAYFMQQQDWLNDIATALELQFNAPYYLWAYRGFFVVYAIINLVAGAWMLGTRRPALSFLQWVPVAMVLLDGILLSMLVLVTGGWSSILYWLYLGLIARSAASVPRGTSQAMVNLTLILCFVFTGYIDMRVAEILDDPQSRLALLLSEGYPTEPVVLRIIVMLLMTLWCYAVPVLLERQRRIEEVAREVAAREGALRSAGRLAAEFAHQIKNPLAIINTAVFSLKRSLKGENPAAAEQIQMIEEEVEHADKIITEVMGYARLNEGRVEELNVTDELDKAISEVFPKAAQFPVKIRKDYARDLPPLLMQRRHAWEIFVNLLQNAREALETTGGNVFITVRCLSDSSIEVSIADDGPGIPPNKQERIFEAYFTTKEKGSGLGLATAKQNIELYGGKISVESALGKGALFHLLFPAKTLMNTARAT
jgi:signal transduction histidine kinase